MLENTITFFVSWFAPGTQWNQQLIAIGLALAFGAVWFAIYWTPILKKPWAWAVMASSAILTLLAIVIIQTPGQYWSSIWLLHFFENDVLMAWLAIAAIPQIFLTGLVQEGAKLVPVVVWWWRSNKTIDPKLGLALGAVAGAGFGMFEAVWAHNQIFASGWIWEVVHNAGLEGLLGFGERFFAVAFHIAISSLAGYGLAKGWGWQAYLATSFLHGVINYASVLLQLNVFTMFQLEIYVAAVSILVVLASLWVRWRKTKEPVDLQVNTL